MITQLRLRNWKSFKESIIYIDPLTFLVGTNASGKSNVLDAFQFLQLLMKGLTLEDAVRQIRGGEDWIIRRGESWMELGITIEEDGLKFDYVVDVQKDDIGLKIDSQDIYVSEIGCANPIFQPEHRALDVESMLNLNVEKNLPKQDANYVVSVVRRALRSIFVLDPDTQEMRKFSKLSKELRQDAGNIAGVIAALKKEEKEELEAKLLKYIKPLPERDINKITAVTVGLSESDAMLYCYEEWNPGQPIDARGMSDGTLRFAAIILSLLTIKSGSLLVIDEVDNGLHPSRAKELVKVLKEISQERKVDVLCTTHNPVLMEELGNSMIPFISYVVRDLEGNSCIKLLEDKENLAQLMAIGNVGDLMIMDKL